MNSLLSSIYDRNEMIWGKETQDNLFKKHIAVIGLGGVGSYLADALARSGIGEITLVDFDIVSESNINRQLHSLISNIGKPKTEIIKERINLINPHIKVNEVKDFFSKNIADKIITNDLNFAADAIDTLKSKIELIKTCRERKVPLITCLGAGNRLKPEELYLADISEVDIKKCSFSKNIIYQLKKAGIEKDLPVVASREKPFKTKKVLSEIKIEQDNETPSVRKFSPGSSPFVPPAAGYIMAGYIIRELIKN